MIQAIIPGLFIVASLVGIAFAASRAAKYALSDDCQQLKLAAMTPEEMAKWTSDELAPELQKAYDGKAIMVLQPVDGEEVPAFVEAEIAEDRAYLESIGMTADEARAMARVDGRRVYSAVSPFDALGIAMYLYQQLAQSTCRVVKMKDWASDDPKVIFPSQAAKCLHQMLYIVVKMDLYARTSDPEYLITEADLAVVAEACPMASSWAGGSAGSFDANPPVMPGDVDVYGQGFQPTEPVAPGGMDPLSQGFQPTEPVTPSMQPQVQGASIGRLDLRRMAADANSGALHPAYVLNGSAFM